MRRYLIISLAVSAAGHLAFFSIFGLTPDAPQREIASMYIITGEQFDYIKGAGVKGRSIAVSDLSLPLSKGNTIWADEADVSDAPDIDISEFDTSGEYVEDAGMYIFRGTLFPPVFPSYTPSDPIPVLTDIFYSGASSTGAAEDSESILPAASGQKFKYYICGPVSGRKIINAGSVTLNIPSVKRGIKAEFRFWVAKDGTVNQVVVEEGSGFPLVDSSVVRLVKKWRFTPEYSVSADNYEWGVLKVRIVE